VFGERLRRPIARRLPAGWSPGVRVAGGVSGAVLALALLGHATGAGRPAASARGGSSTDALSVAANSRTMFVAGRQGRLASATPRGVAGTPSPRAPRPVAGPSPSPAPRPATRPGTRSGPAGVPTARASGADAAAAASAAADPAAPTPVSLAVPSIRLKAPLLALGLDRTGALETPPFSMPGTAGWFRDSPPPGSAGAAVIVGHVDTTSGPAVFWNLAALRPGALVDVNRLDGSVAEFTVDRVAEYPKSGFPAREVYGTTGTDPSAAELRLITCGGAFDRARGEYTGNVVVYAHLSALRHS